MNDENYTIHRGYLNCSGFGSVLFNDFFPIWKFYPTLILCQILSISKHSFLLSTWQNIEWEWNAIKIPSFFIFIWYVWDFQKSCWVIATHWQKPILANMAKLVWRRGVRRRPFLIRLGRRAWLYYKMLIVHGFSFFL